MHIDERGLSELLDHSDDLQVDAMRASRDQLAEVVELGQQRRVRGEVDLDPPTSLVDHRSRRYRQGLVGAGVGAAVLAAGTTAALASTPSDVVILQTAASIENLAVATYRTALTLKFIGGSSANKVVKAFCMRTMAQHTEHGQAFNASIKALGGKPQTKPDPVLLKLVEKAEPGLTSPIKVVELAITLETGAAETYVKDTAVLKNAGARELTSSIMGVEAQHVAILLAVKALLAGGAAADITLPPPLSKLPAAAGSVGFPVAFLPTTAARPATEGAVN